METKENETPSHTPRPEGGRPTPRSSRAPSTAPGERLARLASRLSFRDEEAALRRSHLHGSRSPPVGSPTKSRLTRRANSRLRHINALPLGVHKHTGGVSELVGRGYGDCLAEDERKHESMNSTVAALMENLQGRPMVKDLPLMFDDESSLHRAGSLNATKKRRGLQSPHFAAAPPPGLHPADDPELARQESLLSRVERGDLGRRECNRLLGRRVVGRLTQRDRILLKMAHLRRHPLLRTEFGQRAEVYKRARGVKLLSGGTDYLAKNISLANDLTTLEIPADESDSDVPTSVSFTDTLNGGSRVVFRSLDGVLVCEVEAKPFFCPEISWDGRELFLPNLGSARRWRKRLPLGSLLGKPPRQTFRPPTDCVARVLGGLRKLAASCDSAIAIGSEVKVVGAMEERRRRMRAVEKERAKRALDVREARVEEARQREEEADAVLLGKIPNPAALQAVVWHTIVQIALSGRKLFGITKASARLLSRSEGVKWSMAVLRRRLLPLIQQKLARLRLRKGVRGAMRSTRVQVKLLSEMDRRKVEAAGIVRVVMWGIGKCVAMRARVAQVLFRRRLLRVQRWVRNFARRKAFQLSLMDLQWRRLEMQMAEKIRHEEMSKLKTDLHRFQMWKASEKRAHGVSREHVWREGLQWDQRTFRLLTSMTEMRAQTLKEFELRSMASDVGYFKRRHLHCQASFRNQKLWTELTSRRRVLFNMLPVYKEALHRWEKEREHLTRHITHDSQRAVEAMLQIAHARPKPQPPKWTILIEPRTLGHWIHEGWQFTDAAVWGMPAPSEHDASPTSPVRSVSPPSPPPPQTTRRTSRAVPLGMQISRFYGGAAGVPKGKSLAGDWSQATSGMAPAVARRAVKAEAALQDKRRPSTAMASNRLTPQQWGNRGLLSSPVIRPSSAER
eukprot:Hpha_TRINITY_DN17295_c0_g1::TRINITY_DN17295_c0_g1_i1::g.17775::m.17775